MRAGRVFVSVSEETERWCHSVCLMWRESEGVKDSQCFARCSLFLRCLLSLCILWRVHLYLSLPLCVSIHPPILHVFSLFLNMIMQSKGTRGTRLSAGARNYTHGWNTADFCFLKKEQSRAATSAPVLSPGWSIESGVLVAFCQRTSFSINALIYFYIWESRGQEKCLQRKKLRSEKINVRLRLTCVCVRGDPVDVWRHFK